MFFYSVVLSKMTKEQLYAKKTHLKSGSFMYFMCSLLAHGLVFIQLSTKWYKDSYINACTLNI